MLATLGMLAPSSPAAEFWVSLTGSDRNLGTKEQPFLTIATAQRNARELRRVNSPAVADGVRIVLRGGLYPLPQPLLVRSEDSGTATSPTVFQSAEGERAILSGGVAVTGWTAAGATDGLPEAARGHVWMAKAPLVGGQPLRIRQLWVRETKATRARQPNADAMARLVAWDRVAATATIPVSSLAGRRQPDGVELVLEQQWALAILRLKSLDVAGETARVTFQEPESRVEFEHPWPQPILPPKGGGAFYMVNAIEFLDQPGEWFQESGGGRVYYWPRAGEDLNRDEVIAPALETLAQIRGSLEHPVAHVAFRDLGFAHTTWMRPANFGHVPLQAGMAMTEAYKISPPGTLDKRGLENQAWIERIPAGIAVANAKAVSFERCRFEHVAASALDVMCGVRDSTVEGCVFRDVGGNGIQLGAFQEGGVETHVPYAPTDERVVCERVRIANNLVADTANEDWCCIGIVVGYARSIAIEHNEVRDTSYTGISVGWGWTRTPTVLRDNRIHANLIHRVATRVCDTAGIYTLSAQPGTVVSENVVDEIAMSPYVDRPDHWFYLYTDEGSSQITVRDNWCPAEKFLRNANGPGNVWQNNGPMVDLRIKDAAGPEPAFRDSLRIP